MQQEAQSSQRGHATLRVVQNFAKSLEITQGQFEITPVSKACVSSYSILTMSLSYVVSDIFNVE